MRKLYRILAILAVILLAGLYIATFIVGITGGEHIEGMIFLDVVIPVMFWAIALVAKVLKRHGQDIRDKETSSDREE
jgi:hypothetical protein